MPDEKKSERSKVKVGQFRRERSPHSHRFLQSKTEERKRSFLFSPPPLPAFPSPLGRMGTRSRAAVIPLLARLALLLSVTRAQVSVLFFFHLKSTRRRNRSMSYRPKPRRLFPDSGGRGRGYRSLILLAVLGRVWFRATADVLRGQQAYGGALRARWFLRDGQQIEAPSKCVLLGPLFATSDRTDSSPHRMLFPLNWEIEIVELPDLGRFQGTGAARKLSSGIQVGAFRNG